MKTLVAGIGNVFLGDDGFGVEVARRLAEAPPAGAHVVDFGIRGIDLSYALLDGYERVILVDAMPRGGSAGTLYVLEPELSAPDMPVAAGMEAHSLAPANVLSLVQRLGARLPFVRVVGCEPGYIPEEGDVHMGLSEPVASAVDGAVAIVRELLEVSDVPGVKDA